MFSVACADSQALDLVFTPASTSVHLLREVAYGAEPSQPSPQSISAATNTPLACALIAPKLALRRARTAVATAVWWPARSANEESGVKRMEGEILLPRDSPPSFVFGLFSVKVCHVQILSSDISFLTFCANLSSKHNCRFDVHNTVHDRTSALPRPRF